MWNSQFSFPYQKSLSCLLIPFSPPTTKIINEKRKSKKKKNI
jgi:hypothetical protein